MALTLGWVVLGGSVALSCGSTRKGADGSGSLAGSDVVAAGAGAVSAGAANASSGGPGDSAGAGSGPTSAAGGDGGGSNTPDVDAEALDGLGRCRTPLRAQQFGCADDYDAAIGAPSPCGSMCAGLAGGVLLTLTSCTPSVGCAYDRESRLLIGAYYADDQSSHCAGSSRTVISGDYPTTVVFNDYDVDQNCRPPSEASVSPLFNQLFGPSDPLAVGKACRSGHDQCRGSVRLMVCAAANGRVAGDGTCQRCTSDDDCTAEYPLLGSVKCESTGLCRAGTEPVGACRQSASSCLTQSAYYACVEGVCDHCTTSDQCVANGLSNVCRDGECLRAL